MLKSLTYLLVFAVLLLWAAGCSDDKATNEPPAANHTPGHLELVDLNSLIAAVAPPEFTSPVAVPNGTDSLGTWTTGDYPLLGKVFGSSDPQTLYRNINDFKRNMEVLTAAVRVNDDGSFVTGAASDSVYVELMGDSVWVHYSATVAALADPTAIPTAYQAILGETADLDYLITAEVDEMSGAVEQFGVKVTDSTQTIMQYHYMAREGEATESNLVYANLALADSSFTFRGVGYVGYDAGQVFSYGYNMTSENTSDFSYRMSWYSDDLVIGDLLGCIIGGGNKNVEFAMKYRQFMPADTVDMDSVSRYDQVFGPNYSEGTGMISAYDEYLADALIYTYDMIPMEQIVNPWSAQ